MDNSNSTTTWYAFQDPKTNREYFHEPISGKTTWVLPTSSDSTHIVERASDKANSVKAPKGETMSRQQKREVRTPSQQSLGKQKSSRGWGAIGVTIVSILFFNTLFILVLVKALYDNSNSRSNEANIEPITREDVPNPANENRIQYEVPSSADTDVAMLETNSSVKSMGDADPHSQSEDDKVMSISNLDNGAQNSNDENNIEGANVQTTAMKEQTENNTKDSSCTGNAHEEHSGSDCSSLNEATNLEDVHVGYDEEESSEEAENDEDYSAATTQEKEETTNDSEDIVQIVPEGRKSTREGNQEERRKELLQEPNELQQKRIQLQQKQQRGNTILFVPNNLSHHCLAMWDNFRNKLKVWQQSLKSAFMDLLDALFI